MMNQHPHRWIILMMFMVAHAVNDGFQWIVPPLLPAIREHFDLSYSEIGGFFTLFRFFGNILQAPTAYLVYFAPASALLAGGLLWLSAGMFLLSLSTSYWMLVWIGAISGCGRATYHPLAVTTLSRVFGRDVLGKAIGLHLSGSSAGNVIAPLLVGLLLTNFSWRLPLQVWSMMGIAAGLSLFFFLKRQKGSLHVTGKTPRWPFFSRPILIYLAAEGSWGIAQSGMMSFLPLFLVDHRSFSQQEAAAIYGAMALSGLLCRPFLGALMDWMGRRKPVIISGYIIAGLSLLTLTISESRLVLYAPIVLLGIFGQGHSGLSDTFMIERIPSHRREETLGFIYTVRMSIASLTPVLIGILSERISLVNAFLILAAVPALSAILLSQAEERHVEMEG